MRSVFSSTPRGGNERMEGQKEAERKVFVHVAGAVKKPGVYELPEGSRVIHAIEAAGGPTEEADLDSINLAERLKDGQKVFVPKKPTIVAF